ncbi:MAG TPA: serine/threonine-protein kinase [Gemmatimonadaceae bacterium]|nr:serine/threonine-protein kinase [Gemmatimonadaceae bacterium]
MYTNDAKFCTKDGTRLVYAPGTMAGAVSPFGRSGESTPPPMPPPMPPAMPPAEGQTPLGPGNPPRLTTPRAVASVGGPKKPAGPPSHANLAGSILDGRYRVVKKVGEGGMSFVYLAQDVSTSERYAIKVLSPALSQDRNAMARLRREAGLGIRLAHPNVCHIMRLGETEDGLVYVVMPFVEGEILSDRTHRLGHIPLVETVKFVRDMASGLHIAHELKIIHRDLKPENIMICQDAPGSEYAVVMDFGLAKERRAGAELEKLTATGIILGTPEFMSPEQLRGKPLDARTDIYSLALMTYEMLTGKLPFEGRTQQEMMIARLRSDPVPIRKMKPALSFSAAVERVLQKAMERNPDDRYQTAPEFAEALALAAGGEDAGDGSAGSLLGRLFKR